MIDEAKTVIQLLEKRNYHAFFIGGKCRTDLHNQYHQNSDYKLPVHDIDIVTDAPIEEISKIFPRHKQTGKAFPVLTIKFAGNLFELSPFEKDNKIYTLRSSKADKPTQELPAGKLDDNRKYRDFTINSIVQDHTGKYIDYTFKYNGKIISAMHDVKMQIIRCIGNPDERFEEDPIRILRMFRFMSELGYTIDKMTLKSANKYKHLLSDININLITDEFNRIIKGKNAKDTIILMKKNGYFKLELANGETFIPFLNNPDEKLLNIMTEYNFHSGQYSQTNILEDYVLMFLSADVSDVRNNLLSLNFVQEEDIDKILWMTKHFYLITSKDLYHDIYLAKDDYILLENVGRPGMCELIKHLVNIAKYMVHTPESIEHARTIYHAFCEKPYFKEQLRPTDEEFCYYAHNKKIGPWLDDVKEAILRQLIDTDEYPFSYKDYMKYVSAGFKDVFGEDFEIEIPSETVKIDIYGNIMDPAKACQYEYVSKDMVEEE